MIKTAAVMQQDKREEKSHDHEHVYLGYMLSVPGIFSNVMIYCLSFRKIGQERKHEIYRSVDETTQSNPSGRFRTTDYRTQMSESFWV